MKPPALSPQRHRGTEKNKAGKNRKPAGARSAATGNLLFQVMRPANKRVGLLINFNVPLLNARNGPPRSITAAEKIEKHKNHICPTQE
jgi:hypothetical protein